MTTRAAQKAPTPGQLGMALFITSELMFFGGLFSAYFALKARAGSWPPEGSELELLIPATITLLLLSSSVTIHKAVGAQETGDRPALRRWLGTTILLAVVFLGGQAFEYSQLEFSGSTDSFGTLFFTLTGFHAAHVTGGVVLLGFCIGKPRLLAPSAYYWHFVDVVWVVLFVTLYLIR